MQITPIRTGIFREGDDLVRFVRAHVPKLREGSILAISSKVAALAEGRTADSAERERLIRAESSWRKKVFGSWWLTVRDGIVSVNAGIDASNAGDRIILLPKDCYATARQLRASLRRAYGTKKLGVMLTDSRVAPLRAGVTGVALGYAGFKGARDYRGKKDLFGRTLSVTQTNIADCLASAAVLLSGEGSERCPIVLIEEAPVVYAERVDRRELMIPLAHDMYRRLFRD
jgi:coenzyme F420-0:L-glutamate ligase